MKRERERGKREGEEEREGEREERERGKREGKERERIKYVPERWSFSSLDELQAD